MPSITVQYCWRHCGNVCCNSCCNLDEVVRTYAGCQELRRSMTDTVDQHQRQLSSLHDVHRQAVASLKASHSKSVEQLHKQVTALKSSASGDQSSGESVWLELCYLCSLCTRLLCISKTFCLLATGCKFVLNIVLCICLCLVTNDRISLDCMKCVFFCVVTYTSFVHILVQFKN